MLFNISLPDCSNSIPTFSTAFALFCSAFSVNTTSSSSAILSSSSSKIFLPISENELSVWSSISKPFGFEYLDLWFKSSVPRIILSCFNISSNFKLPISLNGIVKSSVSDSKVILSPMSAEKLTGYEWRSASARITPLLLSSNAILSNLPVVSVMDSSFNTLLPSSIKILSPASVEEPSVPSNTIWSKSSSPSRKIATSASFNGKTPSRINTLDSKEPDDEFSSWIDAAPPVFPNGVSAR